MLERRGFEPSLRPRSWGHSGSLDGRVVETFDDGGTPAVGATIGGAILQLWYERWILLL